MSKICKSCGEYYDGEYCTKCGYGNKSIKVKSVDKYKKRSSKGRVNNSSIYDEKKNHAAVKKNTNKNILIFVIIVALGVIVAGLISSGVFSREKKSEVVKNYFEAINQRDFDKYLKCFPSEMQEDYEADLKETKLSKEEYMYKFMSDFESAYGKGCSINATCGKEKKLDNYSMEEYKKTYGQVPKISEAYVISVDVKINGTKKSDETHMECYVGKVGMKWKLFNIEQVSQSVDLKDSVNKQKQ